MINKTDKSHKNHRLWHYLIRKKSYFCFMQNDRFFLLSYSNFTHKNASKIMWNRFYFDWLKSCLLPTEQIFAKTRRCDIANKWQCLTCQTDCF